MQEAQKSQVEFSQDEPLLNWRRRNSYYYGWLDRIYKFTVRPGSRVLHVGCECGDLLAAVTPSYGVGIDADEKAIELACDEIRRDWLVHDDVDDLDAVEVSGVAQERL